MDEVQRTDEFLNQLKKKFNSNANGNYIIEKKKKNITNDSNTISKNLITNKYNAYRDIFIRETYFRNVTNIIIIHKRQENQAEQGKSNKFHSPLNNDLAKIKRTIWEERNLNHNLHESKARIRIDSHLSICNVPPDYTVRATVTDLVNEQYKSAIVSLSSCSRRVSIIFVRRMGIILHEVYIYNRAGSSFRCSSVHRYLAGRNLWGKGKSRGWSGFPWGILGGGFA